MAVSCRRDWGAWAENCRASRFDRHRCICSDRTKQQTIRFKYHSFHQPRMELSTIVASTLCDIRMLAFKVDSETLYQYIWLTVSSWKGAFSCIFVLSVCWNSYLLQWGASTQELRLDRHWWHAKASCLKKVWAYRRGTDGNGAKMTSQCYMVHSARCGCFWVKWVY